MISIFYLVLALGLGPAPSADAAWDIVPCASLNTTPLIEGPQRFTEATKFKVVCYSEAGRVVKRVLNFGPDAPNHWFISEEPVAPFERFGAYMETTVGQTIYTLSAMALGYAAHRPLRALKRRLKMRRSVRSEGVMDGGTPPVALESEASGPRVPTTFALPGDPPTAVDRAAAPKFDDSLMR